MYFFRILATCIPPGALRSSLPSTSHAQGVLAWSGPSFVPTGTSGTTHPALHTQEAHWVPFVQHGPPRDTQFSNLSQSRLRIVAVQIRGNGGTDASISHHELDTSADFGARRAYAGPGPRRRSPGACRSPSRDCGRFKTGQQLSVSKPIYKTTSQHHTEFSHRSCGR